MKKQAKEYIIKRVIGIKEEISLNDLMIQNQIAMTEHDSRIDELFRIAEDFFNITYEEFRDCVDQANDIYFNKLVIE